MIKPHLRMLMRNCTADLQKERHANPLQSHERGKGYEREHNTVAARIATDVSENAVITLTRDDMFLLSEATFPVSK